MDSRGGVWEGVPNHRNMKYNCESINRFEKIRNLFFIFAYRPLSGIYLELAEPQNRTIDFHH